MSDGSVSFLGNWSDNLITGRLMLAARQFLLVILPALLAGGSCFDGLFLGGALACQFHPSGLSAGVHGLP